MPRALPLLVLALALGCSNKDPLAWQEEARKAAAPVVDEHRDAATKKIEALTALGKMAVDAPRVTVAETAYIEDDFEITDKLGKKGNLLMIGAQRAADPTADLRPQNVPFHVFGSPEIKILHTFMTKGWKDAGENPKSLEYKFTSLEGLKFVLAVRVHEYQAPKVTLAPGDKLAYEPAQLGGDAQLFDFEGGKRLAAFPLSVTQKMDAVVNLEQEDEKLIAELEDAFRIEIRKALEEGLESIRAGA